MSTAGRHFNKKAAEEAEKKGATAAKGVDEANMSTAGRHFNRKATGGAESERTSPPQAEKAPEEARPEPAPTPEKAPAASPPKAPAATAPKEAKEADEVGVVAKRVEALPAITKPADQDEGNVPQALPTESSSGSREEGGNDAGYDEFLSFLES